MVSKISIIVPTLNREKDFELFLDMLIEKNQIPYELIIVDQSDSDKTKHLCQSKKYKELSIKYFYISVKSSALARNIAIDNLAKDSDIVLFLDDDVTLADNFLQKLDHFFKTHTHAKGGVANIDSPSRSISLIKKI